MIRVGKINLVVLALLLMPAVAFAQKETKQTREASKFIGLAMTKQGEEERAGMYRQAMDQLRPAMAEDASNAKVWLLAGTALAALGELQEADQAFTRAVELHPAYADEVEAERESAWIQAFNEGIQLMDAQNYDEAIRVMEGAQTIYSYRPEALMNLGALYANAGDPVKGEEALRQAIEATRSPVYEKLDEEQKAEWDRFRSMATANIAQILAQQAITDFQEERFDSAAARFLRAAETNPHSRDYWFNYGQSLWAQTTPREEALATATKADSARIEGELTALYREIQRTAQKTREFDPNNEVVYLMEARTHRLGGDFAGGAGLEAGQAAALRLLQEHDALTVLLDEITVTTDGEGAVTIAGSLKNMKLAEGAPVTLRFTLLSLDGTSVAQQDVTVKAPAPEQTTQFEANVSPTGEVAGWKYVVAP